MSKTLWGEAPANAHGRETGAFIKKRSAAKRLFRSRHPAAIEYRSRWQYKKQHARGALGKPLLKVSTSHDAIDLSRIFYPPPPSLSPTLFLLSRPPGITFTDTTKEVNRVSRRGRSGTCELLEISNANAKEVEPRQPSLRSYGGLAYTVEAGYGCKRDR